MSSFLQKYNQTKRMKKFCFIIGLFLSSFFCFSQTNVIQSMDTNFVLIIKKYIEINPNILNDCNEPIFYKVKFSYYDNELGFWIYASLGGPGKSSWQNRLNDDGAMEIDSIVNDIFEIKGMFYINNNPITIIDYTKSNGYGLYNPLLLNKNYEILNRDIDLECGNVWYPGGWRYSIISPELKLKFKSEGFELK